jgi:hypothetical protein
VNVMKQDAEGAKSEGRKERVSLDIGFGGEPLARGHRTKYERTRNQ